MKSASAVYNCQDNVLDRETVYEVFVVRNKKARAFK